MSARYTRRCEAGMGKMGEVPDQDAGRFVCGGISGHGDRGADRILSEIM